MFQAKNKIRAKLQEGKIVVGSVMYTWSPIVMELAGLAELDFMRVDNEHAWRQDSSAEHLMRAGHLAGITPIMRIDRENPYLIRKALEIGAGAVLVPDVHDAKEVEGIVKASKFPPLGTRGYSGQNWSGGWGANAGKKWIEWSHTEPMVGVMIENTSAVKNIESIVRVDGLDFVLFGPADYAMSLGLGAPDKNHPDVQDAIKKTIAAAQKQNVAIMLGVGKKLDEIKKYMDMGINMLELGSDISVLKGVWHNLRNNILETA